MSAILLGIAWSLMRPTVMDYELGVKQRLTELNQSDRSSEKKLIEDQQDCREDVWSKGRRGLRFRSVGDANGSDGESCCDDDDGGKGLTQL